MGKIETETCVEYEYTGFFNATTRCLKCGEKSEKMLKEDSAYLFFRCKKGHVSRKAYIRKTTTVKRYEWVGNWIFRTREFLDANIIEEREVCTTNLPGELVKVGKTEKKLAVTGKI